MIDWSTWIPVIVAVVASVGAVYSAYIANKSPTAQAEAINDLAQSVATLNKERNIDHQKMKELKEEYDTLCDRFTVMEDENQKLKKRLTELETQLSIAQATIEYLWDGTLRNIEFMIKHEMEPPFKPKNNFRGKVK